MDKEVLKSKIVAKLGSTTLTDRTISVYVENTVGMITDDAQVTDAYIEAQCNILKSLDGQLHNDVATEIKKAKESNQTPTPTPTPAPNTDNAVLEALKKMQENYDSLSKKFMEKETETAKDAVKQQVINAFKAKIKEATGKEPIPYILKNVVRDLSIDENPDVDGLVNGMTDNYNAGLKELNMDSDYSHMGNAGGQASSSTLDDFFDEKADEGKYPKTENKTNA